MGNQIVDGAFVQNAALRLAPAHHGRAGDTHGDHPTQRTLWAHVGAQLCQRRASAPFARLA